MNSKIKNKATVLVGGRLAGFMDSESKDLSVIRDGLARYSEVMTYPEGEADTMLAAQRQAQNLFDAYQRSSLHSDNLPDLRKITANIIQMMNNHAEFGGELGEFAKTNCDLLQDEPRNTKGSTAIVVNGKAE